MNAMVAHHATLVHLIQRAVVVYYLDVATTAVAEVVNMLGIKGALQSGQAQISLLLVRMVHHNQ